jgi:hypothetical protein
VTHDELIGLIIGIRGDLLMHHHPDSRRDLGDRGLPDLVILGRNGLLFAEIKGPDGVLEKPQLRWARRLKEVDMLCSPECERMGSLWRVWQPAHWHSGDIRRELDQLR